MLDQKILNTKMLEQMDVDTYDVDDLITSTTLTISTAKLRVHGRVAALSLTGAAKSNMTTNTNYTLATLDDAIRPSGNAPCTLGTDGVGQINTTDGTVFARTLKAFSTNNNVYVFATYILKNPYNG